MSHIYIHDSYNKYRCTFNSEHGINNIVHLENIETGFDDILRSVTNNNLSFIYVRSGGSFKKKIWNVFAL